MLKKCKNRPGSDQHSAFRIQHLTLPLASPGGKRMIVRSLFREFFMKRERYAWIASLCLMALLAFKLPGTMAQRDDDYAFVRTLVDIHRQISANYVEAVDEPALREKAIEGMFSDLDPFSVYIPPVDQENF